VRTRRQRRRAIWLIVVGFSAAGLALLAYATHVTRRTELASIDTRFSVRGTQTAPKDVALVGIDATTLHAGLPPYPLPRRLDARVIDAIHRAGARAIALDLDVTAYSSPNPADDEALGQAIYHAGNVVLVTSAQRLPAVTRRARALRATLGSSFLPTAGGVTRQLRYEKLGVPSLAVAAVRRAGRPIDASGFSGDDAWIDFAGPAGTIPVTPFVNVLRGKVPASRFANKVVVVGATDAVIQDVHRVGVGGGEMSGPEIQANAIETLLRGIPLRSSAGWLTALLIVLAGLIVPASALRLTGLRWLWVPLAYLLAYAVVAQLAFNGGTILPVAAPALALFVGFLGTLAVAYATDVRDRRRLHSAFARFVPPQVVDEVASQVDDDLRLGGVRLESTVMFCDLRGFTTTAEQLPAERVIELLNRYLTEMSDAILDHGGTVVAYMGDGIMSVFGAPLHQDDHADRALAAARDMLDTRLAHFNAWITETGVAQPFDIGIGICSGPVMSGNVGSARRLEYAAVGDTTNTAARLQAMTKEVGCPILIAGATRRALLRDDASGLKRVGELEVRGRSAQIEAWTFADPEPEPALTG
jgi:adenylate cyclase